MGITHSEFFRTLPAALATSPYTVQGSEVIVSAPFPFESEGGKRGTNRCLEIRLSPESRRRLGALSLPTTQVHFTFSGYSSQDINRFMACFDRAFQRGGG